MKVLRNLVVLVIVVVIMATMLVGCSGSENNGIDNEASRRDYLDSTTLYWTTGPKGIVFCSFSGHDVLDIQDNTIPEFKIALIDISYPNGKHVSTSSYIYGNNGILDNPFSLPVGTVEILIEAITVDGDKYYSQNSIEVLENKKTWLLPISFYSEKSSFGALTITTAGNTSSSSTLIKGTNGVLVNIDMTSSSVENIYAKNVFLTLKKGVDLDTNLEWGDFTSVDVYDEDEFLGNIGTSMMGGKICIDKTILKSKTKTLTVYVDVPYNTDVKNVAVTGIWVEAVGLSSGKTDIISYDFDIISHSVE
ncbi:hypothetical protein D4R87_01160 [bacterium]|nr:MAG: hypothetical protein D4R87_01160 [bacterium]